MFGFDLFREAGSLERGSLNCFYLCASEVEHFQLIEGVLLCERSSTTIAHAMKII